MKNRSLKLCGIVLLYIFSSTLLTSCKKNESSIDEYRYRRYLQLRRTTTSTGTTDTTKTPGTTTGTGTPTTGTGTPTTGTGTPTTGTGTPTTGTGTPTTRTNLLFDFTGEATNSLTSLAENSLSSWNSLGACCSYSIQRSSNFARAGGFSTRYELNKTDADVASSKRTESSRYSHDEPNGNIERWYGISYYLPDDFVADVAPELLTQWQSTKGVSPPLSIWTLNGKWYLEQSLDNGLTQTLISAYDKNIWTDFVIHVKWSTGSDGLIEVWKDGVKVITKSGINTYSGITAGNYMKAGIYKWSWKTGSYNSTTTKRVVYIDEVRIGNASASYSDVAPGK